jgi:hypothetical protein
MALAGANGRWLLTSIARANARKSGRREPAKTDSFGTTGDNDGIRQANARVVKRHIRSDDGIRMHEMYVDFREIHTLD